MIPSRSSLAVRHFPLVRCPNHTSGDLALLPEPEPILGQSRVMASVMALADRYAGSPLGLPILLTGEPGTGKTLLARRIHELAFPEQPLRGRSSPLISVNTAEIQSEHAVSYLFGHARGAYTGATSDRIGALERANGGTLFIDELSNLRLDAQQLLLTSLLSGRFRRMGDDREVTVRVRFVGATNEDLDGLVASGRLRRDFCDRLGFFRLRVPPLRERNEDILPLARHYLDWAARGDGRGRRYFLSRAAERLLLRYAWPGNLRELWLACATATVHADGEMIDATHLPAACHMESGAGDRSGESALEEVLARTSGNKTRTAKLLGISRRTVQRRCARRVVGE